MSMTSRYPTRRLALSTTVALFALVNCGGNDPDFLSDSPSSLSTPAPTSPPASSTAAPTPAPTVPETSIPTTPTPTVPPTTEAPVATTTLEQSALEGFKAIRAGLSGCSVLPSQCDPASFALEGSPEFNRVRKLVTDRVSQQLVVRVVPDSTTT